MRIYADESVKGALLRALRAAGVDLLYAADQDPGAPDENVLAAARAADAILLTLDKDFGELVFRQGLPTRGIILVRVRIVSPEVASRRAERVISALAEADGAFVTLTKERGRVRKLR
jgi:predicted nuclease of predicted toxin-antitoxin system